MKVNSAQKSRPWVQTKLNNRLLTPIAGSVLTSLARLWKREQKSVLLNFLDRKYHSCQSVSLFLAVAQKSHKWHFCTTCTFFSIQSKRWQTAQCFFPLPWLQCLLASFFGPSGFLWPWLRGQKRGRKERRGRRSKMPHFPPTFPYPKQANISRRGAAHSQNFFVEYREGKQFYVRSPPQFSLSILKTILWNIYLLFSLVLFFSRCSCRPTEERRLGFSIFIDRRPLLGPKMH